MKSFFNVVWSIIILSLFFCGCEPENTNKEVILAKESQVQEEKDEGVIVALGDSLTAGLGVELEKSYPSLLEEKLQRESFNFRVINAGVSGETSSGTLSRLNWILSQKPDIVILEIGANDGLRGIETNLVKNNIREILSKMQEKGVIIVLTGMKMVFNLGDDYTTRFNAIYPALAEEFGVIFMPFFLESVAANPQLNRADGIHPNEAGYQIITKNMYPYVVEAIQLYKDALP